MVAVFESLRSFDPKVRPYLESLMENSSKFMLIDQCLKVTDPLSGLLPSNENQVPKYDRFKLRIPYAQQTITWEIIFDVAHWKEPPDFIFETDSSDFCPPLEKINSLVCWDWKDRDSLVNLLEELLILYTHYQLERAGVDEKLKNHMSSLTAMSPESLQVIINKSETGNIGTVNVIANLDVDFSKIPLAESFIPLACDCASLHVCFPFPGSSNLHSQLFLPPHVEKALGGSNSLRIQGFQRGMLLGDYFNAVTLQLKKQVDTLSDGLDIRKDFVSALLLQFPGSVLEYDSKKFLKVVLLLEWNDFFFSLIVNLPKIFPLEPPSYTFKSVYHDQNSSPYTEEHDEIPWSPRWTSNEMARRASEYILGAIKNFQRMSVTSCDK